MDLNKILTNFSFFNKKNQELEAQSEEAQTRANEILFKAEAEAKRITQEARELEKSLLQKEVELEREKNKFDEELKKIEEERKDLNDKRDKILSKLEKVAKLSQIEARELIMRGWEDKLKGEIARKIKEAEEEIKNKADETAREILVDAMRYGAVDYVPEYTLSTVSLPSDEYKGRIIGKEGRNIRAFELATGVDVDLEEEGVIKFSSFDSVKREIAKVAMERLIKDGRIQPERIEEIVNKTKNEIDKIIYKAGEELCHKVGVFSLPRDIIAYLGRFKFRFSYGQNMILHTLEETKIGVSLAHELKADVNTVKLGCLLHDIGKVIQDKEGSHVQLGVELLTKHHLPQNVIDCVAQHHEDTEFTSTEAVIVYISDAVSGGRPGARHEDFQEYLKRIKTIEEAATTKKGVAEAYALQAGRELRVIVRPEEIADEAMTVLAEEIKEDIEKKFPTFPGQVKITVIREKRASLTSHS